MKKQRKTRRVLLALLTFLAALAVGVGVYAGDYYRADPASTSFLHVLDNALFITHTDDGLIFQPRDVKAGFIFYPGGKVETEAYAPLMRTLANEGVLCVAVDMPLRLAVLDMNAADGIAAQYPDVTRWTIGGHSLGGSMAASYAAKHASEIDALVLLAAYSTAELPEGLAVVSLYGTEDRVLNMAKYEQYRGNLPEGAQHVRLEGGNHAQFGSYGPQAGDGDASMTAEAQLAATVEAILPVILGTK